METQPNLDELSVERKETLSILKQEDISSVEKRIAKKALAENKEKAKGILGGESGKVSGLAEAKAKLKIEKEERKMGLEGVVAKELGEDYRNISNLNAELSELSDFEMKRMREMKLDSEKARSLKGILSQVRKEKLSLETQLQEVSEANPVASRAHALVSYARGLREEGHIAATPSVKKSIKFGETRAINGRPLFFHGSTGGGKTSIARRVGEEVTGHRPYMVYCSPETRESHIWVRTAIGLKEGQPVTLDIFGPLARAMQEGRAIVFDEFTALTREQTLFLKGIFNKKIGDEVDIPNNGVITIKPGFFMEFTANLKSEKNPERTDPPPEMKDEFSQNNIEIGYLPKEESYDVMLARLLERNGGVTMSWHDLNTTLKQLCEAMDKIQTAYTDRLDDETANATQTAGVSGKPPGLKEMVLTHRSIAAILEDWQTEKQRNAPHQSFTQFLDQRLKTFITFKMYPLPDRILAAKILASKGFLRTLSEQELSLPKDTLNFDKAARENTEKIQETLAPSSKEVRISIKDLANLDPWNLRGARMAEKAAAFLGGEEEGETEEPAPAQSYEAFFKETMNKWNWKQETIDKFQDTPILENPRTIDWQAKESNIDPTKLGEYTLNPDTANIDWSSVSPDKIKVFDLADLQGKHLSEMGEEIAKRFPANKYKILGIEYWKYILENPDKIPATHPLKDGNYHFFFGSLFRGGNGRFSVPYADWHGSKWHRDGGWLDDGWSSRCRLVLLEI